MYRTTSNRLIEVAVWGAIVALAGCSAAPTGSGQEGAGNVASRLGELHFANDYPTADTAKRLQEELRFQAAVQVYLWSLPITNVMAIRKGHESIGVDGTTIGIFENFLTPKQVVPTGNQETVYAYGVLTLDNEPMVFEAPPGTLYAKLPCAELGTRAFANAVGFWEVEATFCERIASQVPIRVPRVHAVARRGARFVLLLENLHETPGTRLFLNRDMAAGTTPERARDLPHKPALINGIACAAGKDQEQMTSFYRPDISYVPEMDLVAQHVVARATPSRGAAVDQDDVETEALQEGGEAVGARVRPGEKEEDAARKACRADARGECARGA